MELEIISRECIKPSSPTPLRLKTYKLCLLDQKLHHVYIPMIMYYPFTQNINSSCSTDINHIFSKRLKLLRQSLPETLARFYPFAGKIKDNLSVDCNDEGIYFVEARVRSSLNEYFNQRDFADYIYKLIPFDVTENSESVSGLYVAKIQVTTFACGGLVVCTCLSHLFGDGVTLRSFLKTWVTIACEKIEEASYANNDASVLFPQNDAYPRECTWKNLCAPFFKSGRFVTRRFVFDAQAIATLKAKSTSSSVQNPTRVETITAFLSKCVMAVFKTRSCTHKSSTLLTHTINLRHKAKPPLSEYTMGNIVSTANVLYTNEEVKLHSLVYELREAIKKINGDFVKSLQGDEGFLNLCKAIKDEGEICSRAANRITFSSWCNFGFYDIDFGWGKPIWVSTIGVDGPVPHFSNTIILMDTRFGDGIEAWVYLLEEDMHILQLDKELLAFATLDPSPLE